MGKPREGRKVRIWKKEICVVFNDDLFSSLFLLLLFFYITISSLLFPDHHHHHPPHHQALYFSRFWIFPRIVFEILSSNSNNGNGKNNYPSLISNFWFILHFLIWFQNFPPFIQFSKSLILKKKSQTLAQKELERLLLPLSMFENSAFFYDEQFCLFLVVCTREIERDHCQNLGNGMRLILPRLKDSLSFSIKLVMTRRPRKPLSQDLRVLFHLQEMRNLQKTTTITTVIPKPHDQRYFLFQIELSLDKSRPLMDIRYFSA